MSYNSSLLVVETPQEVSPTPEEASSVDGRYQFRHLFLLSLSNHEVVVSLPRQRRFKSARLIGE